MIPLANVGTPLMWAPFLHLTVGNLLLGVGEGLIVAWLLGVRRRIAIPVLIAANLCSALIGLGFLEAPGILIQNGLVPFDILFHLPLYLALLGSAIFLLTLLLEWPFVAALARNQERRVSRSLRTTFLVHVLSYGLLVMYYGRASSMTLGESVEVVPSLAVKSSGSGEVLFIDPADGGIHRIDLDGTGRKRLRDLDHRVTALEAHLDSSQESIEIHGRPRYEEEPAPLLTLPAADRRLARGQQEPDGWGRTLDFRPSPDTGWKVRMGFWAAEGLVAVQDREWLRVAVEVPTIEWPVRFATVLPGDQVVFQLGERIVMLDLQDRKLAPLTEGVSPVVILREDPCPADPES